MKRRLLGAIPLTRCKYRFLTTKESMMSDTFQALGDTLFKLPAIYTTRVLALAIPPFHPNYPYEAIASKNRTPPYISNVAEVQHFDLNTIKTFGPSTLVMSSDGLRDLYRHRQQPFVDSVRLWHDMEVLRKTQGRFDNLAISLLWDALGGNVDEDLMEPRGRVDDTSIIVLRLS